MSEPGVPRLIEGRHHPLVKTLRALVRSGELWSDGTILLETTRLIDDALSSGARIEKVFVSRTAGERARELVQKLSSETQIYRVAPEVFESLGSTETGQGILALAEAPEWSEEDLFSPAPALVVVAAGVQDPGNLGAIIRTAEAFGSTGIILAKGTVSPYNAKVVRATAGSLLRIPILRNLTTDRILQILDRYQVKLLAGVVEGGPRISEFDFTDPVAVAVGSEGAGLPSDFAAAAQPFTIPIAPAVESLNVAAAAAVALYEAARQRNRW